MFDELNLEDKGRLAGMIIQLLDNWEVKASDAVQILALPKGTPVRSIRKYRDCAPLPDTDPVRERVEHLVGIAEALSTTFPRNAHMGPQWMNKPNRRFDNRTPLRVILEDGTSGLINVRAHLDCAYAWRISQN